MEDKLNIIDYSDLNRMALPAILYKYREFDNEYHRRILTDNTVYFASPNSFLDTKDCHPKELFPSEEIVFNRFWEMSIREFPNMSNDRRLKYVNERVSSAQILNRETRDSLIEALFSDYCKCHGVLSVTANPSNSRMWEEYANNHTGFCVGFDSTKLAMASGGGGPVTYTDCIPDIRIWVDSPEEEHVKRVFYKEKKWEYEQEYRLCKIWPLAAIHKKIERNITLPDGCIVSVICGKNMGTGKIEEMRALLNRYQKNAELFIEQ